MNIAKIIRDRRIQLGHQAAVVAERTGLSIYEYSDIEQHADEFETAISAGTARVVCHTLGLEMRNLLGLPQRAPKETESVSELIRSTREKRGLSEAELAERIGFAEETVHSLESTPDFADTLPLSVLYELEGVLGLERGHLIRENVNETNEPKGVGSN